MNHKKAMKHTMFDEFQVKGYWWVPEIEEKVPGILFYKYDEIRLELTGTLTGEISGMFNDNQSEIEIILGFTNQGEEFTLINSSVSNFTFSSPGFPTESYEVNSFIVGGHFMGIEEISFHSAAFYPTYFSKWLGKYRFSKESSTQNGKLEKLKSVSAVESELFKGYIESLNAVIEETYLMNISGDLNESIIWSYKGGIKLSPDQWQGIDWFNEIFEKVMKLYTLFIGHSTYFEEIMFFGEEEIKQGHTFRKKFVYFQRQNHVKIKKKFKQNDVMVRYEDIQDKLQIILDSWFEKEDNLKTVIDLHLSDLYTRSYLETQFLNAVQTLEIYHRHSFEGKAIDKNIFKENSSKLSVYLENETHPDFSVKIKAMLIHGNELSLSRRLRELINKLELETKQYLFGNSRERGKLVQQLVDTRNYLTHYDSSGKKNVLEDSSEMFYTVQRLKALTTIILFKEIGIEEKAILSRVKTSKQYSYSVRKGKELLNKKER